MVAFGWGVGGLATFFAFRAAADIANGTPVTFWGSVLIGSAWLLSGWFYSKAVKAVRA